MKLICLKSALLTGVQIVSKAVPSKTTMSILECILIHAENGKITLTANDTELGIETIVSGNILEEGIIALDAKIFLDIVRKLPDNEIMIHSDNHYKTLITCEKAKFTIMGRSGEDFTTLPLTERKEPVKISQFSLKETINQTIFSISDQNNNKLMTGELFEINNNELRVVSLDGHRISIRKIILQDFYPNIKAVVPGKTLTEISKILSGNTEEMVQIYFDDKHIIFIFGQTTVVSRLIEGEYFKIDQMLSNDYETKLKINKKELLNCIDRATLLVKESDKKPIIINITDYYMELKINSSIGSMKEEIEIEKNGKDIMIGFNPKFLIDALKVIEDEEIDLYFVNPKAPCFIRDAQGRYIYLILPVNFIA